MCAVSFAYPARPSHIVLDKFTGTFSPGKTTFIIGQSGSGKSTVGQLLMRFYDKTSGSISFDGQPLEDLDISWLRQNMMFVEQTNTLFSGTIKDNLAMGTGGRDAGIEEIESAVQFALLEDVISGMPQGLETFVGQKHTSLSGGQKQRVALARARLRDSSVLILDEATSALDQTSRSLVMKAIRKWREGKTNIFITHDLTQIQPLDTVFVLNEGRVVRSGFGHNINKDMQLKTTLNVGVGSLFYY